MTRPWVRTSGTASSTTGTLTLVVNAANGDAIYVLVAEALTAAGISAMTDTRGNSYGKQKSISLASNGPTLELWMASNVMGGNLTITITLTVSASAGCAISIAGGTKVSLDVLGAGASGVYTSGTVETDSVTPAQGADLLLLCFAGYGSGSAGSPAWTFQVQAGELLVSAQNTTLGSAATGAAIWTKPSVSRASQSVGGSAAIVIGGTTIALNYAVLAFAVLPGPSWGGLLIEAVGLVMRPLWSAGARLLRRARVAVTF
jgi:hypothetical protein